jgi:hypothetical protein
VVNENENARVIRELKKQIAGLKEALARSSVSAASPSGTGLTDAEKVCIVKE